MTFELKLPMKVLVKKIRDFVIRGNYAS